MIKKIMSLFKKKAKFKFYDNKKSKKLAYDRNTKKLFSEIPGFIEKFNLILKHPKLDNARVKLNGGRSVLIKRIKQSKVSNGGNIARAFSIEFFDKEGNIQHKFFVKETKKNPQIIKDQLHGFNELLGVRVIEKFLKMRVTDNVIELSKNLSFSLDVVKPHIGYLDSKTNRSYIVYDFKDLPTVSEFIRSNKNLTTEIQSKTLEYMENQMDNFAINLNVIVDEIIREIEGIPKTNGEYGISDITVSNSFIDYKNRKIYLFDPWLRLFKK